MNNVSITEKYALCLLKEKKNFYLAEVKPYLIASMIVEMMIDENLEIIDKDKVVLKDKVPTDSYNKKLYEVIKDMKKDKLPLRNIFTSICFGFSLKNLKEIVSLLQDSMLKDGLVTIENKKGLLGNKEVIKIDDTQFKNIISEIKTEFLEKDNLTDDLILFASLLNSTNFLKNIFSKYEKEELNNKLNEIKNSDIAEKVKMAQRTVSFIYAMVTTTMINVSIS